MSGSHAFVGDVTVEVEALDSLSGRRLGAAVDRRAGASAVRNTGSTWADVEDAFDLWAGRWTNRLIEFGLRPKPLAEDGSR